jgi:hypothetical protein
MGLGTIVVLAAVLMWCLTRGTIDLKQYLDSGIQTLIWAAVGAAIAWSFKSVADIQKKKDDDS